ncbi:polysaccharide biosynthesis C-terminal domain-containing protein [Marinobacterium sp. YM272]|uniref:polysaccharide biosynthesis C-terminal domain-containing protein n=1 Tax=Marinobacterium sp. YM272 TaxID=3421654 RepID=UPI003D7F464B
MATLSRFGLENSLIRYISAENCQKNYASVHGVYRKGMLWALACSILLLCILLMANQLLARWFFDVEGFAKVLWIMSFALPLLTLYTLQAQSLQGLKRVAKAMFSLNVVVPATVLLCMLIYPLHSAASVAWVYVIACFVALGVGWFWWRGSVPKTDERPVFDSRLLLASCLPLWGVMLFGQVVQWSSQLLLGVWGTPSDVTLFATAQRTAMLISFVLVAVNAIAGPKFAAMYRQGDMQGLRRTALMSVRLMLMAAVPAVLFLMLFPEWLMGLFGAEFKAAAGVLMILGLGQFVNIASGSVGYLLSMTGYERQLRFNVVASALLGVGLGVLLIPFYGPVGGAIASSLAVALQSLLGVYQVNNLLGVNTLAFWRKI